jgi:hypothetical protein
MRSVPARPGWWAGPARSSGRRLLPALAILTGGLAAAAAPAARAQDDPLAAMPEGPGREAVYDTCSPCHSIDRVSERRLSRPAWDNMLHRMIEEENMPEPEAGERALVLDYLATAYGPDVPR